VPPRVSALDKSLFGRVPGGRIVYKGSEPIEVWNPKAPRGGRYEQVKTGDTLSWRQYSNLRGREAGWSSKSEYERALHGNLHVKDGSRHVHEADAYLVWAEICQHERGLPRGAVVGIDTEYSRLFTAALRNKFRDTSPDSPFAQLLVYVGLRNDDTPWDVGDTP
jgi:hypothetical protein